MDTTLLDQVRALRARRAFVRPEARTIAVAGPDAPRWLNDLVTAGVARLADGESVRALMLSPTGRIRADLHVLRDGDVFLLVQPADQPEPIDAILAPYVLSSDVELRTAGQTPVMVPDGDGWRALLDPPGGSTEADRAAAEAWRIGAGLARFPVDLDPESLPAEAGLDVPPVTDTAKGCFLGQESVARVRNLGHPTRVVRAFEAAASVSAGQIVRSAGTHAGVVTSAASTTGGPTAVIARIRWDARHDALSTDAGVALGRR
jgi:folate-binding protein YgfZ